LIPSTELETIARGCLDAAERGTMTFPEIAGSLMRAGFEGYAVDFRRDRVTYYHRDGATAYLPEHDPDPRVADRFDELAIRGAIAEAPSLAPGYTYPGFCRKVRAAGCAGYQVSFPGRRAVYCGKTGESHVENFPR
jgi:uncharacterized protein YbcV (DUF1398 family)